MGGTRGGEHAIGQIWLALGVGAAGPLPGLPLPHDPRTASFERACSLLPCEGARCGPRALGAAPHLEATQGEPGWSAGGARGLRPARGGLAPRARTAGWSTRAG